MSYIASYSIPQWLAGDHCVKFAFGLDVAGSDISDEVDCGNDSHGTKTMVNKGSDSFSSSFHYFDAIIRASGISSIKSRLKLLSCEVQNWASLRPTPTVENGLVGA